MNWTWAQQWLVSILSTSPWCVPLLSKHHASYASSLQWFLIYYLLINLAFHQWFESIGTKEPETIMQLLYFWIDVFQSKVNMVLVLSSFYSIQCSHKNHSNQIVWEREKMMCVFFIYLWSFVFLWQYRKKDGKHGECGVAFKVLDQNNSKHVILVDCQGSETRNDAYAH